MSGRVFRRVGAIAVAALTAGSVLTGVAAPRPAGAAVGAAAASPTALHWRRCPQHLECAELVVPVDYSRPDGTQVALALSRHRATDRAHRLGSLVINFGGPGDAGSSTLADFVADVPKEITSRYDLVSFDPRGTGKSRPVVCVDDKTADVLAAEDPTPNGDGQLRGFYDGTIHSVDLVAACVQHNGEWLAQIGTRNVARDLDRIRAAVGDSHLTYLGFSYGTVIGAVYAQMFPERVGHLVLDSPVDLSSSDVGQLRDDATGFEHALDQFLADCAKNTRCAFRSRGRPRDALLTLQRKFEAGATLPTFNSATGKPERRRAGVSAFYTAIISSLYDKRFGWPDLAEALDDARRGDGSLLLALADSYNGRRDDGTYDNVDQVIDSILCDDRFDPVPSFQEFVDEYHRDVQAYPILGAFVGSTMLGCDPRMPAPPPSEQLGDVRVQGTAPILVVGTTHDPATPYEGAHDLVSRVAGSRLLTFDSTEHTAYTKSACIDHAVDAYLLGGQLPRTGTTCRG